MNDNKKSKYLNTQVVLTIRVIVGGYLVYIAYGLFTSETRTLPLTFAAVFFAIVGAVIAVWSLKHLVLGEYQGGKADVDYIEGGSATNVDESGSEAESVEADIVEIPDAKVQAVDFSTVTSIENVEESDITELD